MSANTFINLKSLEKKVVENASSLEALRRKHSKPDTTLAVGVTSNPLKKPPNIRDGKLAINDEIYGLLVDDQGAKGSQSSIGNKWYKESTGYTNEAKSLYYSCRFCEKPLLPKTFIFLSLPNIYGMFQS